MKPITALLRFSKVLRVKHRSMKAWADHNKKIWLYKIYKPESGWWSLIWWHSWCLGL